MNGLCSYPGVGWARTVEPLIVRRRGDPRSPACAPARSRRGGAVYVLALVFLVLFGSLSVALFSASTLNLKMGENLSHSQAARLAAEGGMSWMLWHLGEVRMPPETTEDALIPNLADRLGAALNGTANLGAGSISSTDQIISVPWITLDHGSFSCVLAMVPDGQGGQRCRLTVTGTRSGARCDVSIDLDPVTKRAKVFDYGVASRGRIVVSGSAVIEGVNKPGEASVLSTRSEPVAIEAGGHATITGDLYVTGEDLDYVSLSGGGYTIGGESDPCQILEDHVHVNMDDPGFPEIDITPFVLLTKSIIDSNTDLTGSGLTFNNALVKADTDPDFRNHTVINGVLFIETPNVVTFHAGTTINGIVVTQDASGSNIAENRLEFKGHVTAPGVDALPDGDEFANIKELTGTVILAPGFALTFRGNTHSINGTIAADQLDFRGNSDVSGNLTGTVLGLADMEMSLQGNTSIRIARPTDDILAAGFKHPLGLTPNADSYTYGAAK